VPEFVWQWDLFRKNLLYVSLSLVGALALIGVLMIVLPQSRLFSRLVLKNEGESPAGSQPEAAEQPERIGETGRALTDLRPVGKARFGDDVLVVQTDGEYIDKDSEVVVFKKEGLRLVVRKGV